ncbi:hypothetical protein HPP92_013476 [Vanilla planifolia]|uniref:Uncharacterized protein n=1 Tax=Vanilla planifolia TaxID=51239 RepID=A0A835R216_VANPL|nr:hypothetical protein HPP92_013476 [Vanilla planifolia]
MGGYLSSAVPIGKGRWREGGRQRPESSGRWKRRLEGLAQGRAATEDGDSDTPRNTTGRAGGGPQTSTGKRKEG